MQYNFSYINYKNQRILFKQTLKSFNNDYQSYNTAFFVSG